MAVAEIDVGPLPTNAKAVLVDYRAVGEAAYVKLGETGNRVSRWTVPAEPDILIRARIRYTLRDGKSHVGPGIEKPFKASDKVADRPSTTALVVPEPVVKQTDGPVLEVVQDVPHGSDPNEFIVEVAQGLPAATAAKDGIHAGYVGPGVPLDLHAWDGGQTVWTRLVRLADGRTTDWASVEAATSRGALDPALDHSNGFGGGTIGKWGGASNPASMEVSGDDLRHKAIYAGDIAGYAGDLTDIYAGEMLLYWPGRYITPNIALGFNESIMVGWQPDFTSVTRPTRYAGSWADYAGGPPMFHTDTIAPGAAGEPVDLRVLRDGLTAGGGDEVPSRIEVDIATSSTASPTFAAADFAPLVTGKAYSNVNTYALRFTVRADYNRLVTIDNLYVWHWIWCRARPWHTHSDAYDLLYDSTAAAPLASLTATVALASYDDVRIEVQWKNGDASPSQLFLRFNNDSGSNYYKDGAAAATSLLVGGGTLASGWWEHAVIRIVNGGASGAERACRVESTARWNATTSEAPGDESSVMWDNTADAITSIVFDATVGATPLETGSRFRIWGKRHHAE